jgi:hypothetical protein
MARPAGGAKSRPCSHLGADARGRPGAASDPPRVGVARAGIGH